MSGAAVWLAFALAGLVTFAQRSLFFWLSESASDRLLPPPVQRALRYVAPAAFAAISAPRVIAAGSSSSDTSFNLLSILAETVVDARFVAALVASLVMWRTGKLPVMLVVGMVVFWVLRALGM